MSMEVPISTHHAGCLMYLVLEALNTIVVICVIPFLRKLVKLMQISVITTGFHYQSAIHKCLDHDPFKMLGKRCEFLTLCVPSCLIDKKPRRSNYNIAKKQFAPKWYHVWQYFFNF